MMWVLRWNADGTQMIWVLVPWTPCHPVALFAKGKGNCNDKGKGKGKGNVKGKVKGNFELLRPKVHLTSCRTSTVTVTVTSTVTIQAR